MRLVPFVLGHGPWLARFRERFPCGDDCDDAVALDVLADDAVRFFALVNAGNARAFSGLAMPRWVQLDCATLPTAMVGFAVRRRHLDAALVRDLEVRAGLADARSDGRADALAADAAEVAQNDDGDREGAGAGAAADDLVPVAAYCALPTPEPGHVVGFSLYSLVPGLGLRAKAAGLFVLQARVQTGVTQRDNPALSTHCRFGPLTVERARVLVHTKPETTLVYRLQVPDTPTLVALAVGRLRRVPQTGATTKKAHLDDGDVVVDVAVGVDGAKFVVAVPA